MPLTVHTWCMRRFNVASLRSTAGYLQFLQFIKFRSVGIDLQRTDFPGDSRFAERLKPPAAICAHVQTVGFRQPFVDLERLATRFTNFNNTVPALSRGAE